MTFYYISKDNYTDQKKLKNLKIFFYKKKAFAKTNVSQRKLIEMNIKNAIISVIFLEVKLKSICIKRKFSLFNKFTKIVTPILIM